MSAPARLDQPDTEPAYVLSVDGAEREVVGSETTDSLTTVLRDWLGVREVKLGCATGRCGSCAVRLDRTLVASCTVLAADAVGSQIETVRSVGTAAEPGPVQRALVEAGAVQCGYCTPGMVVAIADLLERDPHPSETAVRLAISGNLCRCTGYGRIVAAVLALAGGAT